MDKEALKILLVRSLDEALTDREKALLEEALREHEWLREEQKLLLAIRAQLATFQAPLNTNFTQDVLFQLESAKEQIESKTTIVYLFPKVAAACVIIMLAFFINLYLSQGYIDWDSLVGIQDVSPEEAYSYLVMYD